MKTILQISQDSILRFFFSFSPFISLPFVHTLPESDGLLSVDCPHCPNFPMFLFVQNVTFFWKTTKNTQNVPFCSMCFSSVVLFYWFFWILHNCVCVCTSVLMSTMTSVWWSLFSLAVMWCPGTELRSSLGIRIGGVHPYWLCQSGYSKLVFPILLFD